MATAVESLKRAGAIYERLGIEPIINAMGTQTILGGSIMEPEVTQAMVDASRVMIRLRDLSERAGEVIAQHTGAEAGLVCAGAAAGMMLQAAACIAGKDPAKIKQLPDTSGMKNEIVVKWDQNSGYVQNWRQSGAKIVFVGSTGRAHDWEIEGAIGEKTAALAFTASRWYADSFDGLDEMVSIGQRHGIPVIVDAAAMLPPPENLRRFIEHGADMVAFSGGKAIRGPQSAGILCGREELVEAAAMNSSPNSSIGRPAKVCREEIVGLMVALERYVERDHEADQRRWREQCREVVDAIIEIPGVTAVVAQDDWSRPVPEATIDLGDDWTGPTAEAISQSLAGGDPPIVIGVARRPGEDLFINPHGFLEGQAELVAQRLRAAMTGE